VQLLKSKSNSNPPVYHSRSFLASISLHLLILLAGWSIFNALKQKGSSEVRLALSLNTYSLPETAKKIPLRTQEAPVVPAQKQPVLISSTSKPILPQPIKPVQPTTITQTAPAPIEQTLSATPAVPAVAAPIRTTAPVHYDSPKSILPSPQPAIAEENYEKENLGAIRSILAERLKYPRNALRMGQQGDVKIVFTLSPSREISNLVILESSGFDLLDNAARNLIESSAEAFPKPSKPVRIAVPVGYKIR